MTELKEFAVSYEGDEANVIMMEPVFFDEDIKANFRVMPNVVTKKKLQFADELNKILQRHVGCDVTEKGSFNIYERSVEVEPMKFKLGFCWDEFQDTVIEELLNKGLRISDLTGTVVQDVILDRINGAVKSDVNRLYWFGDKDGGDADYDLIDGFWTVYAPEIVTANLSPYFDTGSGVALVAGQGIDHLKTVFDNQSLALKALVNSEKRFYVSETVYLQYLEDIEDGGGGDYGLLQMINGIQTPTFRGIPVVCQYEWNKWYDTDLGNTLSHLILLTTPKNMVVATDLVTSVNEVEMWFDRETEKMKARGAFKLGGNYVHHALLSIGY